MALSKFFIQLIALNFLLAFVYTTWGFFSPYIAEYQFLYIGTATLLSFITVASFYLMQKATISDNINTFTKVFLSSTFVKMIITVVFLLVYINRYPADPDDKTFVLPFLLIYLVFMIYEVFVLMQIAHNVTLKPEQDIFIDYSDIAEHSQQANTQQSENSTDNNKEDDEDKFEPPTLSPFQK